MKKVLAFLLAASMLSVSLVGCTSGNDSQSGNNSTDGNNSSTTQPADDGNAGGGDEGTYKSVPSGGVPVSDPGVLPIVENKTDMSVYIQQSANVEDYETNKYTLWMEERTNVHLLWNVVPDQDATQKLNLLLASGQDLPDVIMSNLNTATVVTNANQGTFIPLDDLVANYGYWYKEMLEKETMLKDMMTCPDGHQYSMPRVIVSKPNSMSGRAWINHTWMERLNLETPETTEELRAVLQAFKDQDANGNGDPNDEYPWMGCNNTWRGFGDEYIMNSFVQYNRDCPYYIDDDGNVQAAYDKDAYREGLRYWHSLVEANLFDPTSFSQTVNQLKQVFEDPECSKVGLACAGGQFCLTDQLGDRSREYSPLAPVAGPDGYRGSFYDPYGNYGYYVASEVITSACKNPEMAFRWIDSQYTRESSMRNRLGEPVVDYAIPENGEIGVDGEPATYDPILQWGTVQNSMWVEMAPCYNDFDNNNVKGDDPYELQQWLWNATKDYYEPYINDISHYYNQSTFYTEEDSAVMADIDATLNDYVKQAMAQFVVGDLDIEKDWDQYLKNLEGMRYKERLAIMQKYV